MKKIYIRSLLGACIASVLFCSSVAMASDDFRLYVEGEVGSSFADFDSGRIRKKNYPKSATPQFLIPSDMLKVRVSSDRKVKNSRNISESCTLLTQP